MALLETLLIWLLLWGLIGILIAGDATQKGRSAGFWFMAVFFLGIFGILAYVISVGVSGDDKVENSKGRNHDVGTAVNIGTISCPKCSRANPRGSNFCGECGYKFDQPDMTT